MNPLRHVILCLVACASLCATAYGQKATIIEYNGKLYGLVVMPTGQQIVLKEVVILKAPSPVPVGIASQLIILRDQTAATTQMVAVLLDLQEKYQKGTKPEMYLLDRKDPSSVTKSYLSLKPQTAAFPYYFLVEKGGRILDQGEVASTLEKNVAIIAKYQEKK